MKRSFFRRLIPHIPFVLVILTYFVVGFGVYADYGIPLDEYNQIQIGKMNYERIVTGSREVQTHYDRYYGPAFEMPLYVLTNVIAPIFTIEEMPARHMGVFLFFGFSLVLFYLFLLKIYGNPVYGWAGVILLVLTPRFFAESFYNTKDIAFVSATICVLYAMAQLKKRSWTSYAFLSLATGFSIAMRAQGLLLLAICAIVLFFDFRDTLGHRVKVAGGYIILTLFFAIMMFPVFWTDTVTHILGFGNASANPLGVPTYYFGTFYISPDIPWHYHFVWIGITGLISVLGTSLIGIFWYGTRLVRRKNHWNTSGRMLFVMLLIIAGTFATSVFFRPRSYDGWRHIYYVYPSFIGFALFTLRELAAYAKRPFFRWALIGMVGMLVIDGVSALGFIWRNHPHQYVYFNLLAGNYSRAKESFDFDYWGISYKQIFEYLNSLPIRSPTYIYYEQPFPYVREVMTPRLAKKGMITTERVEQADLFVTIQRDHKEPPPAGFRKIYAVTVEGADLSAVYSRL